MPISAEERAARSLRMKEAWQKRKAQAEELPADPAVREAMAKVPMNAIQAQDTQLRQARLEEDHFQGQIEEVHRHNHQDNPLELSSISVNVDWDHIPLQDGQHFYAHLKDEFERAGRILNARSMQRVSGYTCFMCKKHFDGNPGFTDYSYTDPATGLSPRVDCCGELCVINYNAMRINQRHQRDLARAQQERNG